MSGPHIAGAAVWCGSDGFSDCVMSIDIDGRLHITVNDRERPGYTASFGAGLRPEIAAFIAGGP